MEGKEKDICCSRFRIELAAGRIQPASGKVYIVNTNPFVKPREIDECPYCRRSLTATE